MNNFKVSETIWAWKTTKVVQDAYLKRRKNAIIESLIAYVVAIVFELVLDKHAMAIAIFSIASIGLFGGLFMPSFYVGFKRVFIIIARAISIAVTWVLLLPFFYICFTFGRIIIQLQRKDPLQRGFDPAKSSYWSKRRKNTGMRSYRRQY